MIRYNQTQNNFSEPEIPKPVGYKKQFFIELPRGEETKEVTVEEPITEETIPEESTQETPVIVKETPKQEIIVPKIEQTEDCSEQDKNILLNDGSSKDKSKVASKYLQKKLGLSKEQAAALVGVWPAESAFDLNAENQMEKEGKSKYVKATEYGIGIGQ